MSKKIRLVEPDNLHNATDWVAMGINHIVLFDGAAYSGNQFSHMIESMFFDKKITVHVVILFMTKIAKEKIEFLVKKYPHRMTEHQVMPTFYESLSPEDPDTMDTLHPTHPFPERLTLTYFDHKIADSWSTFYKNLNGQLLNNERQQAYIPTVHLPYKGNTVDRRG